jgi:hypothetical protein
MLVPVGCGGADKILAVLVQGDVRIAQIAMKVTSPSRQFDQRTFAILWPIFSVPN